MMAFAGIPVAKGTNLPELGLSFLCCWMMAPPPKSRKRKSADNIGDKAASTSSNVVKSPYFSTTKADSSTTETGGSKRLPASFFDQPCEALAKGLLGQRLIRKVNDDEHIAGEIVETEAYLGKEDSACHSYEGRRTNRNEAMYMKPGVCYVYLIYGMYDCLNISSRGDGEAVLIRALEPKEGIPVMQRHRSRRRKIPAKELKTKDLCNGPGKLTEALCIKTPEMNRANLASDSSIWMERGDLEVKEADIVGCPRVGIDYATEEWVKKPLRFYIRGNGCVSKRDKEAEQF
ncbi:uncharacterized protein [Asterias amurensis]|uniref:uncharacterized protein isoform X1 n=2 Tax=Asterias amurensis TaxID=7602 RepID=UPI003AB5D8A6